MVLSWSISTSLSSHAVKRCSLPEASGGQQVGEQHVVVRVDPFPVKLRIACIRTSVAHSGDHLPCLPFYDVV